MAVERAASKGTPRQGRSLDRQITTQDIDCLREAFALFTRSPDEGGEITTDELGKVLRTHGFRPSDDELKAMIDNVGKDAQVQVPVDRTRRSSSVSSVQGGIDFDEFIAMMTRQGSDVSEDIAHSFKVFDRDSDGLITKEELMITMNNLGEPLSEEEVVTMIEEADLDGDGKINFMEFKKLMENKTV